MTTHKRIDGDYNIVTLGNADNVMIQTHTVEIRGNLDVVGNLTYINVSELNIKDPFIMLNTSNTGSYAANSGVLTHITSSVYAGIRYNDASGLWEISNDTGATGETGLWEPLATANTAATAAGANTEIQFNQEGYFGASSNLTFDYSTNKLTINGYEVLANIGSAPAATANSVTLYHNAPAGGGSGVYFKTPVVEDELISRKKALIYSIIF